DVQVAVLDTSCVVPFSSVAVAANCDVLPTAGAAPVTATLETVVAEFGELPQAPTVKPTDRTKRTITNERTFMVAPCGTALAGVNVTQGSDLPRVARPLRKYDQSAAADFIRAAVWYGWKGSSPSCGSGCSVPFFSPPSQQSSPTPRTSGVSGC